MADNPLDAQSTIGDHSLQQIYHELLKQRIVVLGSPVDDDVANHVTAQLLLLESEHDDRDIMIYLNSPGGSVGAGMAIYDTMQYIKPDVGTVCMGLSASMGQFLLCAGAPGKRYALRHARIMMHQPSGGIQGQAVDVAIQAAQMAQLKQLLAERMAYHTGQTVEQVTVDSDRDRWFSAAQAKEYGIIDHVIDRQGEIR